MRISPNWQLQFLSKLGTWIIGQRTCPLAFEKARAAHAEREIGVGWQGGKETWRSETAKKGVRVDFFSSNQALVSVIERLRGMGEIQQRTPSFPFLKVKP